MLAIAALAFSAAVLAFSMAASLSSIKASALCFKSVYSVSLDDSAFTRCSSFVYLVCSY
jgi:hypothetical protein